MARIKRYISDVEGLLRSEQSSIMSPQQAAATEMAKYGAAAAGFGAASDISQQFAEIRAEEELNSAVAQYDSATAEIDDSIDRMPPEVDEEGNQKYTPNRLRNMQEGAHKAVTGEIRKGMSSASAQRAFDRMVLQDTAVRREKMMAQELKAEAMFRQTAVLVDTKMLIDKAMFGAAEQRNNQGLAAGAIDPLEHAKLQTEIGMARDNTYVFSIINDPTRTPSEIREATQHVIDGVHPDGTKFVMDFKERYALRVQMLTELNRRTSPNTEAVKAVQRSTYVQYDAALRTDTDPPTYAQVSKDYMNGDLDKAGYDDLIMRINEPEFGLLADDERSVIAADQIMSSIINNHEGDMNLAVSQFRQLINGLDLTQATRDTMVGDMRDRINAAYSDPRTKNLIAFGYRSVTGYEEGALMDLTSELYGQFNELAGVGAQFKDEIMKMAAQPQYRDNPDKLEAWIQEQTPAWKLRAVSGQLEKITPAGAEAVWEENMSAETLQKTQDLVATWISEGNAVDRAREARRVSDNIYRLTRIRVAADLVDKLNRIESGEKR